MGRLSARGFAAYGTAKAALAHYTRLSALDLCPRIRVNAIAPGSILTSALDVINSNTPVNEQMRGEVLADLGDWFLVANGLKRAYESYADAWKSFAAAGDTSLLDQPRILAYRPSISSVDRSRLDPTEAVVKVVDMRFTVDRDGR